MKDLKSLYLYVVCVISLIVSLTASYTLVSTLIKDVLLDIKPSYVYDVPIKEPGMEGRDVEQMQKNYINDAYIRAIDNAVLLGFFLPVFIFHYRKTDLYKRK